MANQYSPGLIQIRPQYGDGGPDTPENILWVLGSIGTFYTLTQLQALQAVFDPAWGAVWQPAGETSNQYVGSIATDWGSNTGFQSSSVGTFTPVSGSKTGLQGDQVAVIIAQTLAVRYKGGHPRIYLPGIGSSALQSQTQISTTVQSALSTAFGTLQTDLGAIGTGNGGPYSLVVYRFRNDPVKHAVVLPSGHVVRLTLGTQRRRLRRITRK